MKRKDKLIALVYDIFRELYKHAEPSANFDEMLENATINERGEKVIPMDDHVISGYLMKDIVDSMMKRKSCGMILKSHERIAIKFEVYLGASPKIKNE